MQKKGMILVEYKQTEIKKGIKLHTIKTEKFKTNLIAIILTTKLNRENVTKNALIPAVLRRGTKSLKTQEEIKQHAEEAESLAAQTLFWTMYNNDNH